MGGLGAAISRRLLAAGLTVAVSHSEGNDHVATWLTRERDAGRIFHAFEVDVADFDSCQRCGKRVIDQLWMEALERGMTEVVAPDDGKLLTAQHTDAAGAARGRVHAR
ncbi:hypothetical protein WJ36_14500 [Burkholderia ubonensis]|nr:hypothetical protein WJ36_14500 [Burkholderia ubonensis]